MDVNANINIKREVNRFVNRFFYHKEKTKEQLALMFYYVDDLIRFMEDLQIEVANELLKNEDFKEVFLEEENIKVFLDEELNSILIDSITSVEKRNLIIKRNEEYRDQQTNQA